MSECVLQTENLSKTFGTSEILHGVDLSIGKGEVYGLVGQNGAGKTTLLRLINNLMKPTSGTVRLRTDRPYIGYMPQSCRFDDQATVSDTLRFFVKLRGTDMRGVLSIGEKLRLDGKKRVRQLSPGQQKKLQITIAMIGEPDFFILDEPTAGLDPAATHEIKTVIGDLHRNGKSILISSHILQDMDEVCTNIAILEGGRLTYNQELESCFVIRTSAVRQDAMTSLLALYPIVADASGTTLTVRIDREQIPECIAELGRLGISVFEITAGNVRNIVREQLRLEERI